jgi:hypothetical protein
MFLSVSQARLIQLLSLGRPFETPRKKSVDCIRLNFIFFHLPKAMLLLACQHLPH